MLFVVLPVLSLSAHRRVQHAARYSVLCRRRPIQESYIWRSMCMRWYTAFVSSFDFDKSIDFTL